ncbi:22156_t:CDS:2 [Dentiscutata erythropus]|uniref:22156_t:CDS:1 n=1 Tax=Dentiscutata erythropus TaxID=1348616 RepID=A0A9N9B454_9GLOM|nr:22156_t:CDS:2 [Dentiscutata erythropus]
MTTQKQHDVRSYFPYIDESTRKYSVCSKVYKAPLNPNTTKSQVLSNRLDDYINDKKKKAKSKFIYSDTSTTSVTTAPSSSFVDVVLGDEIDNGEDVPEISNLENRNQTREDSGSSDFEWKGVSGNRFSMKNIMNIETEDNSEYKLVDLLRRQKDLQAVSTYPPMHPTYS